MSRSDNLSPTGKILEKTLQEIHTAEITIGNRIATIADHLILLGMNKGEVVFFINKIIFVYESELSLAGLKRSIVIDNLELDEDYNL